MGGESRARIRKHIENGNFTISYILIPVIYTCITKSNKVLVDIYLPDFILLALEPH